MKKETSSVVSQVLWGREEQKDPFPVPSDPGILLFDDVTPTSGRDNCLWFCWLYNR